MLSSTTLQLFGIIVSLASILGAAYAVRESRKKLDAEAENFTADTMAVIVKTAQEQVEYINRDVKQLRDELAATREQLETAVRREVELTGKFNALQRKLLLLLEYLEAEQIVLPPDLQKELSA